MCKEQNEKLKNTVQSSKPKLLIDRAFDYALMVIALVDELPSDTTCKIIGKQLLRSGTSIGANITEAQASASKREFVNFFNYALKSANESRYWIRILRYSKRISKEKFDELLDETTQIANIIAKSIITAKGKRISTF